MISSAAADEIREIADPGGYCPVCVEQMKLSSAIAACIFAAVALFSSIRRSMLKSEGEEERIWRC
jgi:hypothetical protein